MDTKEHIEKLVRDYTTLCQEEYGAFCASNKIKQNNTSDDFAELKGTDYLVRKLYEIPETLHTILKAQLSSEDWVWFNSQEGSKWFAKKFKAFRAAQRV